MQQGELEGRERPAVCSFSHQSRTHAIALRRGSQDAPLLGRRWPENLATRGRRRHLLDWGTLSPHDDVIIAGRRGRKLLI